jgi:hypothetical protein
MIQTRDVPRVLGRIRCSPKEEALPVPADHNEIVMAILKAFSEEVRHRRAQQRHGLSVTAAQSYVLRELRVFYSRLEEGDTDLKAQVSKLEEAFRQPVTAAIRRQLNTLRRNGVVGTPLVRALTELYHDHGLHERVYEQTGRYDQEGDDLPRVICSEALL